MRSGGSVKRKRRGVPCEVRTKRAAEEATGACTSSSTGPQGGFRPPVFAIVLGLLAAVLNGKRRQNRHRR